MSRSPVAVFYISGHGFGHASREVEIINAFGAARPDVRLVVRSAVAPTLLDRTLRVPVDQRPGPCDTGVVQSSSVAHDDAATVRETVAFYRDFDARIDEEVARLADTGADLVVGDIPPLAFEVAPRLDARSVAIGNFSWDWIYEHHAGLHEAAPWLVPRIRAAYRRADLALELPFSGGFEAFTDVRRIPLAARHPGRPPEQTRARFSLPAGGQVALLSFGGYGLPALKLDRLDCLGDWTVVTTDRVVSPSTLPRGVVVLEEAAFFASGFRYEDLVAAADVVVSKPGYGIIAECIACGPSLLYTSRGTVPRIRRPRARDAHVAAVPVHQPARPVRRPLARGPRRADGPAAADEPDRNRRRRAGGDHPDRAGRRVGDGGAY